ncbi:unnamed protein product [Fraxinus pennsylvanica]|uniref:RRM domain-containing protein n=1 Tax=Fraxinus pennsylvanica TaxID=56036 RepID=A0AAD2A4F0_9LAMI|nr:unnamed protein product [Fraxinus pennsylvanica]
MFSQQIAVSTNKEVDAHTPNYPSLPPQLICQLHNVTMHADIETDDVYAQMTLQQLSPCEERDYKAIMLYIGRIPHGFYDNGMEDFFNQFGTIKRLQIARNRI